MSYRTEFHVHTKHSPDSVLGKRALLFMCKLRRIDCVAITDHNEVAGAIEYKRYLARHGVDVIVGEEVFTSEGEVIGLFLQRRIEPALSPEETIELICAQGGIVYVPHPYDLKRKRSVLREEALERSRAAIHCIEGHNGRNICRSFSLGQKRIAREAGLPCIVGSDAHCFFEVGRNYCVSDKPFERDSFVETLLAAEVVERPCIGLSHWVTRFVKVLKMAKEGRFDEIRRAVRRKLA